MSGSIGSALTGSGVWMRFRCGYPGDLNDACLFRMNCSCFAASAGLAQASCGGPDCGCCGNSHAGCLHSPWRWDVDSCAGNAQLVAAVLGVLMIARAPTPAPATSLDSACGSPATGTDVPAGTAAGVMACGAGAGGGGAASCGCVCSAFFVSCFLCYYVLMYLKMQPRMAWDG